MTLDNFNLAAILSDMFMKDENAPEPQAAVQARGERGRLEIGRKKCGFSVAFIIFRALRPLGDCEGSDVSTAATGCRTPRRPGSLSRHLEEEKALFRVRVYNIGHTEVSAGVEGVGQDWSPVDQGQGNVR